MIVKKRIPYFACTVFFFSLLMCACARNSNDAQEQPEKKTVAVEGRVVELGSLVDVVRSSGAVKGIREAWIVLESEGIIKSSNFRLGDRVLKDQILLTLDGQLAEQNRNLAEKRYRTALLEFQAAEQSRKSGSISALQFSRVTDALLAAETSSVMAIDAFNDTRVKAPFSGVVAAKYSNLSVGNYLPRGVQVARIVDDSLLRTEVAVGEGQVLLVQNGATVNVTGKDGLVRLGRVMAVSAGTDGSTGSFTIVVEWPPLKDNPLRSGMSVDVAIRVAERPEHVIALESAIRIREGEEFVYVDVDGTADFRRIQTGKRLGEQVEVLSGLDAGEVIITSGISSLTPDISISTTIVGEKESE